MALTPTSFPLRALFATVIFSLPALAAPSLPRAVVMPVTGTDASQRAVAQSLTELARSGQVRAIGTSDLVAVLGLERQRQLVGCGDRSSSCLTEISAALGAEWLVSSTLGRVGKSLRFDLKVIHASDARVVFRDGRSVKEAGEIFDVVTQLTRALLAERPFGEAQEQAPTEGAPRVATAAEAAAPSPVERPRLAPWVTVGVGAVSLGVGVAFTVDAATSWSQLQGSDYVPLHTFQQQQELVTRHNRNAILGPVLGGVGLAAVAGGVLWALLPQPVPVSFGFVPGSNLFVVGGAL
jgi:hypothetical protein